MKKKLFLIMLILAVFSIPVYAEMPDDTLEVLEEGLCSEGVPYEVDGSIALPSSYNLRSLGMVTSVKDQGDKPYCLTYARIAALESALIKKGYENASVDLSETSMLYEDWVNSGSSSPFGLWCEYSGCETIGSANSFDNQFHLRNFPVYEYQMPMGNITDDYMPDTTYVGTSPYEIKLIYLYWPKGDIDLRDIIRATKEGIYRYGGVAGSLSYVPATERDASYRFFGNGKDYTYYLPQEKSSDEGHAIEIVGWDDGFSKDNFSQKPPYDGAWLCKNSWGSVGGSSGYFWMSYYSKLSFSWTAFDVTTKGKSARGLKADDITLYAGQTSQPISVQMIPDTADPIDWYIDIPKGDPYLTVNADRSVTCKKFQKSGYLDDSSYTRTVE